MTQCVIAIGLLPLHLQRRVQPPFHPVMDLPPGTPVLDLSRGVYPHAHAYSIGRYAERREGVYTTPQYAGRVWHMGIDLGAPAGTEIRCFGAGVLHDFADHARAGDYGPTLVTRHDGEGRPLYALWGHLSRRSLEGKTRGQRIEAGERLAWVGSPEENGGWPPHLHLQLSWEEPRGADLPGVVSDADFPAALQTYPDPRLVLGALYVDGKRD